MNANDTINTIHAGIEVTEATEAEVQAALKAVENFTVTQVANSLDINNTFPVKPLSAFKNVELAAGQYLVRKIEKGTGLESKGVVVTATTQEDLVVALESEVVLEAATVWYQEVVAEVVKARIAAGAIAITPADYTQEKVVEYLQAKEVSEGRVSKEKLAVWFTTKAAIPLAEAFKAKLGEVSDEKLTQILASYRDCFTLLTKKEIVLTEQVKSNLEKATDIIEAYYPEDTLVAYCKGKLEKAADKSADLMAL